ncbi:MAG TPA: hypothetical protein VFF82_09305 [Rhodocyclaceae bacterium]|nr:hypothetical protein [Rhodocyclaceae bacterium]
MNTEPEKLDDPQAIAQPAQAPEPAQTTEAAPPAQFAQAIDPRRRLRELLSVPERDRTDEQWDEINELEIQLAPGNRVHPGTPSGAGGMPNPPGGGRHFQQKKHPPKGDKGGGGGGGKRRPRPNNPNK